MEVVESSLCTGCGACYAICPHNAITMKLSNEGVYRPSIDNSKCKLCKLCQEACPAAMNNILPNGLGKHIHCYSGFSSSDSTRWNGSSGGIVTEILCALLDTGLISGAVVSKSDPCNPIKPSMLFVDNNKDIRSAAGSKYCPVKPSFKVADLINKPGKIAVVGLPCHIWAFRRLEELNCKLKSKVLVHIGLLCGRCPNFYATSYFFKKNVSPKEGVRGIRYRGNGWPGRVSIKTNIGAEYNFKYGDWISFSYYPPFVPIRCVLCYDLTNQQADLSVGDAWGLRHDKLGVSAIISRTPTGEEILKTLLTEKKIVLSDMSPNKIMNGQKLNNKIEKSKVQIYIWKNFFRQTIPISLLPMYPKVSFKCLAQNFPFCLILYLSKNYFFRVFFSFFIVLFPKNKLLLKGLLK